MPEKLNPGHKPILGQPMENADTRRRTQWHTEGEEGTNLNALTTFLAVQESALNRQHIPSAVH